MPPRPLPTAPTFLPSGPSPCATAQGDGPLSPVHSREMRGVEILVDVFEVHTPGIFSLLEKAQNLGLDPSLLIDRSTVLQILNLLLELRTAAGFRIQPRVRDVGDRHTRFVKRIQKPAITAAIRCCVTTGQHLQGPLLASAPFVARSTRTDCRRFNCPRQDNAGRAAAAPA